MILLTDKKISRANRQDTISLIARNYSHSYNRVVKCFLKTRLTKKMHGFSSITSLIEIATLAIIFNYILSFFWNTRSMDLFLGLLALLVTAIASSWFSLPIMRKIVYAVANVAVLAVVVIFQPELRLALSKFGIKGKRRKELGQFDKFLDLFTSAVYRLSERQFGALIVLENNDLITEFAKDSISINATFSPELLETIFSPSTPLHDGAVLMRNTTILSAGAILPLAEDYSQIYRNMGTRHRAALGASLQCDGVIIVVSEETGRVSIARDGIVTRGIKSDRFKAILRSLFISEDLQKQERKKTNFNLLEWLRQ
jgi:diadenylate cyclase